jgi:hypothetical protein
MIKEKLQMLSKSLNEFTFFTPAKNTKQIDVLQRLEMFVESISRGK